MADLGNAWHIATDPMPRGVGGMRDPVGAIVPGTAVTIYSGNQSQGDGNPGNQLQDGSAVFFKRQPDASWTMLPMLFRVSAGNDKYYAADIPGDVFAAGDTVEYYLRIPYDDHAVTFLHAANTGSAVTGDEGAAQRAPYSFAVEASSVRGHWGPVFDLPNVAVHAHLLAHGKVLLWGRRDRPDQSLDVHECTPQLWDPATGAITPTPQPALADGTKVNLFCSGHTQLADGRLLVVGGHLLDREGLNQACTYDPESNTWTATTPMTDGRWYPTAITLPTGAALVLSGSFEGTAGIEINGVPEVWTDGRLAPRPPLPKGSFELYPCVHVTSDGHVVMTGSLALTWLLNPAEPGQWSELAPRDAGSRDFCPSVMYDIDKIIYIGGGNDVNTQLPADSAELLDLTDAAPRWQATAKMNFRRRQHNATLLPDGTVLVTGGTRGGGGLEPNPTGFNDLSPGQPVHVAERWDPVTGQWTELAAETVDRCYHSTAVLLPDATVLSAGGGEYRPGNGPADNDPQDSHRNAQIFSPPYLFQGAQPEITTAPAAVGYGTTFGVGTTQAGDIGKVSLVRLGSVTHSFNVNQRINFLSFGVDGPTLRVTAPASAEVCPPGHYMLFILSKEGVPSVAKIIQVEAAAPAAGGPAGAEPTVAATPSAGPAPVAGAPADGAARRAAVRAAADGTVTVVGITGTCPYGIAACWGGAHEALLGLERVQDVDPIPDADESTATVFLTDHGLPDLRNWERQFTKTVNGSYDLRGVEVTVDGLVKAQGSALVVTASDSRPQLELSPILAADKVQWDRPTGAPATLTPDEANAFERLAVEARANADGRQASVTGPLKQLDSGYRLEVRWFTL